MKINMNISKLAQNNGMTISDLENVLGFSSGTIEGWQVGNPTISVVILVADYFGVSIGALSRQDLEPDVDVPFMVKKAAEENGLDSGHSRRELQKDAR